MRWLLDTNIISYWMRGHEGILRALKQRHPGDLAVSSITVAEIRYGIEKSPHRQSERLRKLGLILAQIQQLPFDGTAAAEYGVIRAALEQRGTPIGERDTQIAAIAAAHNLTIVTHNVREFARIPGIPVEDWIASQ